MVKFFSQTHKYQDNWQIVTLAYFLRYPNPYASHILACDVVSRTFTDAGNLKTSRLIKKSGAVPSWFPQRFVGRAETWVMEESEVDVEGRVVTSRTKNLDHVKVMQVQEDVVLQAMEDGTTMQKTTANIMSNFGWGLTKRIEKYGITKFRANLERSRQGISLVVSALRDSRQRLQPLVMGFPFDPPGVLFDHQANRSGELYSLQNQLADRYPDHASLNETSSSIDPGNVSPSVLGSPSSSASIASQSRTTWFSRFTPWKSKPTTPSPPDSPPL